MPATTLDRVGPTFPFIDVANRRSVLTGLGQTIPTAATDQSPAEPWSTPCPAASPRSPSSPASPSPPAPVTTPDRQQRRRRHRPGRRDPHRRARHGPTDVPAAPQRVVVLDTPQLDAAAALGVTPVGATRTAVAGELPTWIGDLGDVDEVGTIGEPNL